MNLLIDLVPNSVIVDGEIYKINSDFRTSILFEMLMQDPSLKDEQKLSSGLELFYEEIPPNVNEAVNKIIWFYKCGKENSTLNRVNNNSNNNSTCSKKIYSFEYDDEYIYSAFLDQYGVDLQDIEYLHWWKFKAMFKSLKGDTEIVKIMGYRAMDLSKIKDKGEKSYYKKMKELYKIPNNINKDEKAKLESINSILLNGGDISKVLK